MAKGMISNPGNLPFTTFIPTQTGTSSLTLLRAHGLKYGRFIYITARVKVTIASTDGMNLPAIKLTDYPPLHTNEYVVPSTVTINKSNSNITYADLVSLRKWTDNNIYAVQGAVSQLSVNDIIEFSFCYITE